LSRGVTLIFIPHRENYELSTKFTTNDKRFRSMQNTSVHYTAILLSRIWGDYTVCGN